MMLQIYRLPALRALPGHDAGLYRNSGEGAGCQLGPRVGPAREQPGGGHLTSQ
jgi:hypothetical protein